MKYHPDSQCTIDAEHHPDYKEKAYECSTLTECYNYDLNKYDAGMCPVWESCANYRSPEGNLL